MPSFHMILSGEKIAKKILENLKKKIRGKKLSLAVIQVGDNIVSKKYIEEKRKIAKKIGIGFHLINLPLSISQVKLEQQIKRTGKDQKVSGMIVQLPLPGRLNVQRVVDLIPKEKDVDVLSSASFSDFALGILPIMPPTVAAIALLLKETKKKLEGSRVAVVGAGRLVGLPVALWLAQQGAIISLIQKETKNATQIIAKADIIISGVGKPGLITGKMVKKGAVVIDAGTSIEQGSSKGDVERESVEKKASFLTPVPGGVGPLTVACLFKNLFLINE
ncbi:bifunctional 5,10-methylenetetrahydrofolate dehydrogenase/5,10-methenyltetrahydrofolate cyclohydrolase [Patescibacteria group bacterium]|nr:bifunctional 5,10-methylenetetrahydrofolate dehydrogenase/5,10-methenyltetrahydrofolate cyclohydrolase [Patescibacteria group bacterium]